MCGIAGVLTTNAEKAPIEAVECMVSVQHHRGPDACGVQLVSHQPGHQVVLGHTRLSIIDLSPAGKQPMSSANGERCITYNGEIYNYRTLRDELGAERGWRSQSDTEVLLESYATWGRACVERLRGMFAFGVWDAERQELFLSRDRLGIKPLYYYSENGVFVFASEVRALLASRLVPRRLDPVALDDYLAYQSLPAPRTLIQGVSALLPGAWIVVDRHGRVKHGQYWDLLEHATRRAGDGDPAASRRRVGDLLREAVALHLVSDVPVGAFLSGGIDSSAVVGLMREAGHVPHTFSVAFSERAYDETRHARSVAARFHTEHTEILLGERDLLAQLPEALSAMDQPTGDGVNTFVVSRAVHGAGITVALSGLGGDELFAGYPSFARLSRSAQFFRTWGRAPETVRALAANTVRALGRSSVSATKTAAMLASRGRLANLHPVTRQVLSPRQRRGLFTPAWSRAVDGHADPYVQLLEAAYRDSPRVGVLASIAYAEARTYMHDVLLRDTDQMSMAHSLEVRVPLLDHVLVEYVMGLPDADKQPNGVPKRLLVESLGGLLPDDIVHRPKQGFSLPFDVWMRDHLRTFCEVRLGPHGLGGRDIFQPQAVRELWSAFLSGHRDASWSRLWVLVVLEDWLQRNGFQECG
ncbi:MAG: asparagine synthase (glutamine-hydrolyzing) [Chloroflexota bacterium]|nr:asparagine synthase (glutamine-hydrolyzing) [Chloroflexota bacterium]